MSFAYTPYPGNEDKKLHRVLRKLPALSSYLLLAVIIAASLLFPAVGASIIIILLLYYIFRVVYNLIFLIASFVRIRAEEKSDWLQRVADLRSAGRGTPGFQPSGKRLRKIHESVLAVAGASASPLPDPDGLVHLVIIPVYKEGRDVYEAGIRALSESVLDPAKHIVVVLAMEERSGEDLHLQAEAVRREYSGKFRDFLVLTHPAGLPGEVPGKGSNVGYAAQYMTGYFSDKKVDFSNVLLTCIDADAVVSPQYFACLSYYFLAEPERTRACFQPLPVFSNNIWQVPSLVRVVEMSSTVFQLVESTNTDMLVTFSCYSYSFQALAESGFWPADVIAEDAAVFWKTFLHFRGDFRAVPLPVTVHMDAAEGPTFWKTIQAAYKQKMRWAYGAENLAIVFRGLFRHRLIRGKRFWEVVMKFMENNITIATWPLILSVLIWLPRVFEMLSPETPLPVFNLGSISSVIFQLATVCLVMIVAVSGVFAYRGTSKAPLWKKILYPLEWLVVLPVASIIFGAIPALHAQTKLGFGKPLVYVPMDKQR